ncbi:hypothetical protein LIA77_00968 [Sarocladium implicatum]|nr:hypothetical protein LIA77_00968 [Sarocladium implicatum]
MDGQDNTSTIIPTRVTLSHLAPATQYAVAWLTVAIVRRRRGRHDCTGFAYFFGARCDLACQVCDHSLDSACSFTTALGQLTRVTNRELRRALIPLDLLLTHPL